MSETDEQPRKGKIAALNEEARNIVAQRRAGKQIEAQLTPLFEQLKEQIDMIPVHLRTSLQPTVDEMQTLQTALAALPDAVAYQIAPLLDLTEHLDEVLRIQRATLDELAHHLTEKMEDRIQSMLDQVRMDVIESVTPVAGERRYTRRRRGYLLRHH